MRGKGLDRLDGETIILVALFCLLEKDATNVEHYTALG